MAENSSQSGQPRSGRQLGRSSSSGSGRPQPTKPRDGWRNRWWNSLRWLGQRNLYRKYRRPAETVKIAFQMLIGIVLGVLLLVKALADGSSIFGWYPLDSFAETNPLDIIAYALFFSSGVELAFMLFTPGPDEVLDPIMMGLAAAILLGVSRIDFSNVQEGVTLLLAVFALAGLFLIKRYIYEGEGEKDEEEYFWD